MNICKETTGRVKNSIFKLLKFLMNNWSFLVLIGSVLIVYRVWVFTTGAITAGDWLYFSKDSTVDHFWGYLHLWRSCWGLGGIILDIGQAPSYLMVGFYAKYFHLEYRFVERLVHLYPVVILTPFSIWLFLSKYFKNKIAILVGSIFFTYNTYFLFSDTGHLTLMAAFSLVPLIFYFFDEAISKISLKYGVITALVAALCAYYEPRVFYVLVIILFFYFLFSLIEKPRFYLSNWKKLLFLIVTFCFIEILLNLFWIVGLISMSSLSSNELSARNLFGGNFWQLQNSIAAYHPFWSGDYIVPFTVSKIPWYQWAFPIVAFLGFFVRKDRIVIFFGFLAVVGIFLSKQTSEPISFIYPWLYKYFPGFNMFREASKFYFLVVMAYSVLISSFISWFFSLNLKFNKIKLSSLKTILALFLIGIAVWNARPLISGRIDTLFKSRSIPEEYLKLDSFISSQDDFFRVLWTPAAPRWGYYSNKHPKNGLVAIMYPDWEQFSNYNPQTDKYPVEEQAINLLKLPYSEKLLDLSSMKYLIVPSEDDENNNNMYESYGPKDYYISNLDKLDYLKRVDAGTDKVTVYQVRNIHPYLYKTDQVQKLTNDVPYESIATVNDSATRHKMLIKNVKTSFYLNYSEKYHPGWKVRAGKFNWLNAIRSNKYFLSDSNHFQSEAGLNYWYIDINDLKGTDSLHQNNDGSYDVDLTLYFRPQSYYNIGIMISASALILVLSSLIAYGFKNKFKRRRV